MINIDNLIEKSYPLSKKTGNDFRAVLSFKIGLKNIKSGNFYMLNYKGCQKPFSVFGYENDIISFMIENRGECSKKMINADTGDYFGLTGPLGNSFKTEGLNNFLIIGGGIGTAPVLYLANNLKKDNYGLNLLIGERTKENIIYNSSIDLFKNKGIEIFTDDGSMGIKGYPTDILDELLDNNKFDTACICGPEIMMKTAIDKIKDRIDNIQVCMERYMKCGIGLCGSCVLDDIGLRVCKEGPVFDYKVILSKTGEFGSYHRDGNGVIKKY